jgi:MOSC domain-containing protein YiiM
MIGVEHCDRCGFDRSQWNEQDAARTIAHAGAFLVEWSADAPPNLMAQLDARRIDDLKAISTSPDLFDEVHHLWHGLVSIADVRRAAGDVVHRQRGVITQISTSDGGVPKSAVGSATVGVRGVDGDVQATRAHHGRPWQALCLWSQEVIDDFAAAGHPIAPGNAGENITISGIDWSTLHGGTIIDLGAVRCQLSAPAVPCQKNAQWFIDGDISLMDHDLHPGSSRWYASVLRPGSVTAGHAVTVSPV